jgi:4-phosphopantoate--beta-alanine ligase
MRHDVPQSHPRRVSLEIRDRLVRGFEAGVTAKAGLFAHGRGEAFDYILGEATHTPALEAIRAAVALLLLAKKPVISVNGNVAALCAREVVELSEACDAALEVNLFYRSAEREKAIEAALATAGAKKVLGVGTAAAAQVEGLDSPRGKVDPEGIFAADVVFLALEDGDRTEALVKMKKQVIAVDLNPFSRTAQYAQVTIVDNITRVLPAMVDEAHTLEKGGEAALRKILKSYNNNNNLKKMIRLIYRGLRTKANTGVFLEIPG